MINLWQYSIAQREQTNKILAFMLIGVLICQDTYQPMKCSFHVAFAASKISVVNENVLQNNLDLVSVVYCASSR